MLKHDSRPNGYFVTGTDTEVGKTLVAAAILLKLQGQHTRVAAFKPVVAGLQQVNGEWINEDLVTLHALCTADLTVQDICPYQLKQPAAPHIVAEKEDISLSYETILSSYHHVMNQCDAIVVEGVGGFLVPLNTTHNTADFAQAVDLPVILVVGMKLGCINHALLTAEAIRNRGLELHGWVANTGADCMPLLDENIQTLSRLLNTKLLGVIPKLEPSLATTPYSLQTIQTISPFIGLPPAVKQS